MKTLMIGLIAMLGMLQATAANQEETVVATYESLTDEGYFHFTTEDGKTIVFHHIEVDDVDLFDESYIGTRFKITYSKEEWEDYDDDGNLKPEPLIANVITAIEKLDQ